MFIFLDPVQGGRTSRPSFHTGTVCPQTIHGTGLLTNIGVVDLGSYLIINSLYIYIYLALPRGAQWRPVSSVEISIGDPRTEAAGYYIIDI